jgi:SprT protein
MEDLVMSKTDSEVKQAIIETGDFYLELAEELYGKKIKRPEYRFDLEGAVAGYACYGPWAMRFNMHIAHTHYDKYLARTVPHEVAHMVEKYVFGTSGHGKRWKSIMVRFGCEPSRCHSYDQLKTRGGKDRPRVICGCGERDIGPIKYKRMVSGHSSYTCGTCKQGVRPANGVVVKHSEESYNTYCSCRKHSLGPTKLKRLKAGTRYWCKTCKEDLQVI